MAVETKTASVADIQAPPTREEMVAKFMHGANALIKSFISTETWAGRKQNVGDKPPTMVNIYFNGEAESPFKNFATNWDLAKFLFINTKEEQGIGPKEKISAEYTIKDSLGNIMPCNVISINKINGRPALVCRARVFEPIQTKVEANINDYSARSSGGVQAAVTATAETEKVVEKEEFAF